MSLNSEVLLSCKKARHRADTTLSYVMPIMFAIFSFWLFAYFLADNWRILADALQSTLLTISCGV